MIKVFSKFAKTSPKKNRYQFGVDIGSYSIKVCVVKTGNGTKELAAYAAAPIKNNDIKQALEEALGLVKVETKSIIISAGTQGALTRQITLPKMTQAELKEALKFEIEKYIPYKPNEVMIDSQIVKQDIEPNKMLVLVAAAKKDVMEKRMSLIKDIGLKILAVDVDAIALSNAFTYLIGKKEQEDKGCPALLNIGDSATSVIIIKDALPYVTRDIFIAGRDLTKKISQSLNIEFPEAEGLKCYPKDREKEVFAACELLLQDICSQIRMSFDYFENQQNVAVEKIYLSGGTSKLASLAKSLQDVFGIEVSLWGGFSNLVLGENIDKDKFLNELPSLAVSLGLALR